MPTAVSDFVEQREDLSSSPLWNPDLAPTPLSRRTWSTYHIAALWIGMSVVITTYTLASGLMQQGMTWWQATLTILLGNTVVLVPMILNAHAGTKYGVSFPVLCRASFGVKGANVPAILRALVACGWFGIQTWIGALALNTLVAAVWPPWSGIAAGVWISFAVFWLVQVWIIVFGALIVMLAQLTTNMAANVVSPANDFSSLAPRRISYVTGGLITAAIGVLMMPWKLYADAAAYIFTWLIGYSSLMGAIGGILIADYWVLRKRELSLDDLFKIDGRYTYDGGINRRAMAVLAVSILPVVPGFVRAATTPGGQVLVPTLWDSLYTYAWFVTFGLSFALYLVAVRLKPAPA